MDLCKKDIDSHNTMSIHFVTLKILLHEGRMNVYDCNLMVTKYDKIFTLIQHVFQLLPKLLKQNGIMNHLPGKLLTQPWEFDGRMQPMVQNATGAACRSYSLALIENLISGTELQPPNTQLCENLIEGTQYIWANGIISQSLNP